jgi:hypothetical protein
MSAPKSSPRKAPKVRASKRPSGDNQLPDLDHILDALGDASALVEVVYLAFQTNGRDGPEQSVLCRVITDLACVYEQLDCASSRIRRLGESNASASRGAS